MMKDRVALVTGASRGIGHAIALALGAQGARVAGTATSDAGVAALQQAFDAAGIDGFAVRLSVESRTDVEASLAAVRAKFGEVSILVNNAGITRDNLLLRMREEEWDQIMATNLKSVYQLSKEVLRPMMKARWGRIINVTSVVGHLGNAGQANYAAAKAGVTGFTKSLAREVGSRNITVNCVAPGFIDTDMTRALPDAQRDALLTQVPLGRFGDVDEVAAAVTFLASENASYVTGSTIHVNGGMLMD
jgi:3-oxoacyl-[acyl-carrier protein] reductase